MPAADGCDALAASLGESDEFLDLGDGFGLDVERGQGGEGAGPGCVGVVWAGAEGDVVVGELGELRDEEGVHCEVSRTHVELVRVVSL